MFFIHFLSSLSLLITSVRVAFSTVPVNSIVFLIFTFISAALMLFFFSVDFLSLVFIVVYASAIAILFLFVVMMVAIKTKVVNAFSVQSLLNFLTGVWLYFFLFFFLISFFNVIYSKENYFLLEINSILLDNWESVLMVNIRPTRKDEKIRAFFEWIILLIACLGIYIIISGPADFWVEIQIFFAKTHLWFLNQWSYFRFTYFIITIDFNFIKGTMVVPLVVIYAFVMTGCLAVTFWILWFWYQNRNKN